MRTALIGEDPGVTDTDVELAHEALLTMQALERLADVLARAGDDLESLAARALHLRGELADGRRLTPTMRAEVRPLVITRMTELVDELTTAALAVRRAEARQLRAEGATQQQVAEIFGVSRQRVAALLADPPDGDGRRPHRPRPRDASPA